eukprot:2844818-Amphidinium_carterae.3
MHALEPNEPTIRHCPNDKPRGQFRNQEKLPLGRRPHCSQVVSSLPTLSPLQTPVKLEQC